MKFKVPISLRHRRRYIYVSTSVSHNRFREELTSSLKKLFGEVGLSNTPVKVIQDEDGIILRTYHDSMSKLLVAIYHMSLNGIQLEVWGVSGTINKLREGIASKKRLAGGSKVRGSEDHERD